MIKHYILSAFLICSSVANAGNFDCMPSQLGGTGTRAAWGFKVDPLQFWGGWKCGTKLIVSACVAEGCLKAKDPVTAFVQAPRRTLIAANGILTTLETTNINDPVLRAVWVPHKAVFDALK